MLNQKPDLLRTCQPLALLHHSPLLTGKLTPAFAQAPFPAEPLKPTERQWLKPCTPIFLLLLVLTGQAFSINLEDYPDN